MIHYTCDCCKRVLDADELRYVVRLEIYAALDDSPLGADEDNDHLQEVQDILQHAEEADDPRIGDDVYEQKRFDLCANCRKRLLRNPLGLEPTKQFDFSQN